MTLALLCQFTAQHVSDVNTSIFRSLRLHGALLCKLYCADLRRAGFYVAGLAIGDVVSECRLSSGSACTRIPHHQQPIPLHNTNTPQVSTIQPKQ